MKRSPSPRFKHTSRRAISKGLLAAILWGLAICQAADESDVKVIDRTTFSAKYPVNWKEDVAAPDYKADSNFVLNSPKQSYVQFNIVDKAGDPQKVLDNAVFNLDGLAITSLSKTKITEWGPHKGIGLHLKGKILDATPGGIKVFVFNSNNHNILVVEYYYSSELKDAMGELQYISDNFKMKD